MIFVRRTHHLVKLILRSALLLGLSAVGLPAQTVVVTDLGPGGGGRILRQALAGPHRLVEPDTSWFVVARGERVATPLVVLGRTAAISGFIDGDVVVIDGDLHVRPGAHIAGRAVAIGGGVYPSVRSVVIGGVQGFRDYTYDISRTANGYRLAYRAQREYDTPSVLLPGIYGLRLPTYDRVNGASVPLGPSFSLFGGRAELDALLTYRSDLGKIDPAIVAGLELSRRLRLRAEAQRGTFTNDAWIWSNLVNSLSGLALGTDTRNYYRADRAELTLHRLWEGASTNIEPFIGGRVERGWSVGPAVGERRGPWSILNRNDPLGMWRANPSIVAGSISSALAGSSLEWLVQDVRVRAHTLGEMSFTAPRDERFTQVTSDLDIDFPTFKDHEYTLDVRWVTTFGRVPPPQRFSYLGGSGTLPFLELLEQGGDELLLVDQRYTIPLLQRPLKLLGVPMLLLRHRLGSAGVARLPEFEQVVGVGVLLTFLKVEIHMDPASRKIKVGGGLSFSR
jgi:hypothetical protein